MVDDVVVVVVLTGVFVADDADDVDDDGEKMQGQGWGTDVDGGWV